MIIAGAITTIRDIKQEKEIAILFRGGNFFLRCAGLAAAFFNIL